MKFEMDLTKVQDIKPIPAGTYVFKIVEIDASKLSKSGNKKMVIKYEIMAPKVDQKLFWNSLSLVESAWFKVKQLVEAAGLPIKPSGFDTNDLLGREVGAVVTEEDSKEYGHRNQISQFLKAKETKPELAPKEA